MRIHLTGAGGNAGILLARCLKDDFLVTGEDDSYYAQKLIEVPRSVPNTAPDMIWPVSDTQVMKFAGNPLCFLPDPKVIALCQNKSSCQLALKDLSPKRYWERDVYGAGGKGAKLIEEYLPGKNYSVELLFFNDEMKAYFMKERIAYDLQGSKEPTHQRGTSLVSTCINRDDLYSLACEAIRAVHDGNPAHGLFGVDFKENEAGVPKITEINAGRLLTASYVYFKQYNIPKLAAELFLGLEETPLAEYPEGVSIVRQFDSLPWIGRL